MTHKPPVAPGFSNVPILWAECLHGQRNIHGALASLAEATSAAVVTLYRWCKVTQHTRIIHSFRTGEPAFDPRRSRPFPIDLGSIAPKLGRPGAIWQLSEDRTKSRLAEPVANRVQGAVIQDVLVISLGQSDGKLVLLELCFDRAGLLTLIPDLPEFARSLAFAWERRPGARAERTTSRHDPVRQHHVEQLSTDPLSIDNPWGLTAAEMRICGLIREGHDPAHLLPLINVTESTLRSHLRSIYAKAGVTGQLGLVRRLLSGVTLR